MTLLNVAERRFAAKVAVSGVLRPGEDVLDLRVGVLLSHRQDEVDQPISRGVWRQFPLRGSGSFCGYSPTNFFFSSAGRVFSAELGLLATPRLMSGNVLEFMAFTTASTQQRVASGKLGSLAGQWRFADERVAEDFVTGLERARLIRRAEMPHETRELMARADEIAAGDDPLY